MADEQTLPENTEEMDSKELIDDYDKGEGDDTKEEPTTETDAETTEDDDGVQPAPEPEPLSEPTPEPAPVPEPTDEWDARVAAEARFANVTDEGTRALLVEAALVGKDLAKQEIEIESNKHKAEADASAKEEQRVLALMEERAISDISAATTAGRLPKVEDAANPQDPGLSRQREVWAFMQAENSVRQKDTSRSLISDFASALDLLEARELIKERDDEKKRQADIKKQKGSMIAPAAPRGSKGQAPAAPIVSGMSLDAVLASDFEELRRS